MALLQSSPILEGTPAVCPGLVNSWPAVQLWKSTERLTDLIGASVVPVMYSSDSNRGFIGDMSELTLVDMPFQMFWREQEGPHLYLAQCPIVEYSDGKRSPGPLWELHKDLDKPSLLPLESLHTKEISSVNGWFNWHPATSSLHYDPHENMLCVVQGRKTVWVLPPSATPTLQGCRPAYSDSANHSSDSIIDIDQTSDINTRTAHVTIQGHVQKYLLEPGDALYIPQGWWHQVVSESKTVGVNIWWDSPVQFHTHENYSTRIHEPSIDMRGYVFRLAAQSLVHDQKLLMLLQSATRPDVVNLSQQISNRSGRKRDEQFGFLHHILYDICKEGSSTYSIETFSSYLYSQGPNYAIDFYTHIARSDPELLSYVLSTTKSPLFWEHITTGLEPAATEEFYDTLYGFCTCSRSYLTACILEAKAQFAKQAMARVLHDWLSLDTS